jgi:hypothetical protein
VWSPEGARQTAVPGRTWRWLAEAERPGRYGAWIGASFGPGGRGGRHGAHRGHLDLDGAAETVCGGRR